MQIPDLTALCHKYLGTLHLRKPGYFLTGTTLVAISKK
ncbi:hypothetical protein GXM_05390 [Nostoc sphaeroides CCNUC1]|uniref:Uncharacterized protein n=1 Tax=Nostoc sphaeroides CCNUC1 TaxID=2653204 RepID=A0A5P8W590_9NOSO|nr:hypothetical protein GXM_05390 [Nostoc sphaeroides CCNUC1]